MFVIPKNNKLIVFFEVTRQKLTYIINLYSKVSVDMNKPRI